MTQYASKSPRDLNRDPEPFACTAPDFERYASADDYEGRHSVIHDPRAEYDHTQHNEPNPILRVARGAMKDGHLQDFINGFMSDPLSPDAHPWAIHARKVLSRLSKEEQ